MGKGLAAVLVAKWIAAHWSYTVALPHDRVEVQHLASDFAGIAAALGCILGHSFPIWLRFKGGKGVATSLGVIIGMMPVAAAVDFALWSTVFGISGYVSLASIVAALGLPVIVVGLLFFGWVHGLGKFLLCRRCRRARDLAPPGQHQATRRGDGEQLPQAAPTAVGRLAG
jgi:glycerol-3-phosphate acyltransferase PlsY